MSSSQSSDNEMAWQPQLLRPGDGWVESVARQENKSWITYEWVNWWPDHIGDLIRGWMIKHNCWSIKGDTQKVSHGSQLLKRLQERSIVAEGWVYGSDDKLLYKKLSTKVNNIRLQLLEEGKLLKAPKNTFILCKNEDTGERNRAGGELRELIRGAGLDTLRECAIETLCRLGMVEAVRALASAVERMHDHRQDMNAIRQRGKRGRETRETSEETEEQGPSKRGRHDRQRDAPPTHAKSPPVKVEQLLW